MKFVYMTNKAKCTRNVTGRLMDAQNGHIINTGCEVQEYKFSNFADMYLGAVADPQTGRCFYVGTKNVVAIDNLLD
jgi:hypothetical protein